MCFDPVSIGGILSFAVGAMSSVMQYQQQQAVYRQKQAIYDQNYANSLAEGRDKHKQLQVRELQEQKAYAQKDHFVAVEGAEKAAEASVASAGTGVSGISVSNLLNDVDRSIAQKRATLQENYEMTAQQLRVEQEAVPNQTLSRINSVENPIAPSPGAMIIGIMGAGVRAFGGGG